VGSARLTIDVAIPCGLIVNELVTNALKHAFPDGRSGKIWVVLQEDPVELRLEIEDDGVGMPESLDPRNTGSLGLDLVFTFAEQLDATVEIGRKGGTSFQFRFPKAT
jgi:two-component sensor histidine kinase